MLAMSAGNRLPPFREIASGSNVPQPTNPLDLSLASDPTNTTLAATAPLSNVANASGKTNEQGTDPGLLPLQSQSTNLYPITSTSSSLNAQHQTTGQYQQHVLPSPQQIIHQYPLPLQVPASRTVLVSQPQPDHEVGTSPLQLIGNASSGLVSSGPPSSNALSVPMSTNVANHGLRDLSTARKPRNMDRLPLDDGPDPPSEAYLGHRYFDNPLPPRGVGAAQQHTLSASRSLSGNAANWTGSTNLSDSSFLNPSISSLTSSGRGGSGNVVPSGVNYNWSPSLGNSVALAGNVNNSASHLVTTASLTLGNTGGITSNAIGGTASGSSPGFSQDWGLGQDYGSTGNAGNVGITGSVGNAGNLGGSGNVGLANAQGAQNTVMAAAAVAAAVANRTNADTGVLGAAAPNVPASLRRAVGNPPGTRMGASIHPTTAHLPKYDTDLSLLTSLGNTPGAGTGLEGSGVANMQGGGGGRYLQNTGTGMISQGMRLAAGLMKEMPVSLPISSSLDSVHPASFGQPGVANQDHQEIYQQQPRMVASIQQQAQPVALTEEGIMPSDERVGLQQILPLEGHPNFPVPQQVHIPSASVEPTRIATSAPTRRRGRPNVGRASRKRSGSDQIEVELTNGERKILHRGPDGKFPCPECDKRLVNAGTLSNHIKSVHQNAGKHICQFCPRSKRKFMWPSTLDIHIRHVHKKERPYPCTLPGCTQGFRWQSHLTEHVIVSHEKRRDYTCDICKKLFGRKNNFQKHMRNVHHVKNVAIFQEKFKETGSVQESYMASNNGKGIPATYAPRQASRYSAPQTSVAPPGLQPQQRRHRLKRPLGGEGSHEEGGQKRQRRS